MPNNLIVEAKSQLMQIVQRPGAIGPADLGKHAAKARTALEEALESLTEEGFTPELAANVEEHLSFATDNLSSAESSPAPGEILNSTNEILDRLITLLARQGEVEVISATQ